MPIAACVRAFAAQEEHPMADANRYRYQSQTQNRRDERDSRRGYDETVHRGPPLDTDVARGEYHPRHESLAPAGVRGYGEAGQWGTGEYNGGYLAGRPQDRTMRRTDEPITNAPPDFGNARAWGREGGWYHGGTGALRRTGPKGYKRSDDRVTEDICEHLMNMDDIDASDVTVQVHDGCVKLEGSVPERSMRYEIEDIAATTLGVTDVENHIRVPRRSVDEGNGGGV
jgi:hypothetical protein